jgi:uncharacterized protein (TIGR00725 family)
MSRSIQIGVIGARYCSPKISFVAEELGNLIAKEGWTVICGGHGGVMEAVSRGAYNEGGVTIGILPESNEAKANPYLTHVIKTGMAEARNMIIVQSSDALVAVDGKYGTLSEIALALARKKHVLGIGTWDIPGVEKVGSPEQALRRIKGILSE